MGAWWVEVDRLIREVSALTALPHAEALAPVVQARDLVAETAMVIAAASVSGDRQAEARGQDRLAQARVAVLDAERAVRRAQETAALYRAGHDRALQLMAEARALRAKDGTATTGERMQLRVPRSG